MKATNPAYSSMQRLIDDVVLLTEAQAAQVLQLAKGTLRNARATGSLSIPFIKLTPTKRGKIRYKLSEILLWAESRTHTNTRQAQECNSNIPSVTEGAI